MCYEDRAVCKSAEFRLIELFSLSLVNLYQLTTCVYNHVISRCINEREYEIQVRIEIVGCT